jgi:hypothetical protein
MCEEAKEAGLDLPGERDADEEMWDLWKQRQGFRNKRDRVMMNRFQMCIDRAEKEIQWWSMDSFEREYLGIEMDMFKSKKFCERLRAQKKDLDSGEQGGPTSSKVLHFDDKALRSIADNAVGISVAMLDDYDNKRICEVIVQTCVHVKHYRTVMVKVCRSSNGHRDWFTGQSSGGAWRHVLDGLSVLTSVPVLEKMRFTLPTIASNLAVDEALCNMQTHCPQHDFVLGASPVCLDTGVWQPRPKVLRVMPLTKHVCHSPFQTCFCSKAPLAALWAAVA